MTYHHVYSRPRGSLGAWTYHDTAHTDRAALGELDTLRRYGEVGRIVATRTFDPLAVLRHLNA
jgi:hypothetical protein